MMHITRMERIIHTVMIAMNDLITTRLKITATSLNLFSMVQVLFFMALNLKLIAAAKAIQMHKSYLILQTKPKNGFTVKETGP